MKITKHALIAMCMVIAISSFGIGWTTVEFIIFNNLPCEVILP